jgi:hypothetical protein
MAKGYRDTVQDYGSFKAWYIKQYGTLRGLPANDSFLLNNDYYKYYQVIKNIPENATVVRQVKDPQGNIINLQPNQKNFAQAYPTVQSTDVNGAPQSIAPQLNTPNKTNEVVSMNGYDFLVTYDKNGENPVYTYIGKTETSTSLTPYQEAQLRMQQDASNQENQYLKGQIANYGEGGRVASNVAQLAQLGRTQQGSQVDWAGAFESARQSILDNLALSPYRNWIKLEEAKTMANPYQKADNTFADSFSALQEEKKRSSEAVKTARDWAGKQLESGNLSAQEADMVNRVITWDKEVDKRMLEADAIMADASTGNVTSTNDTGYFGNRADVVREQAWATPRPAGDGTGNMALGEPDAPQKPKGIATPDWLRGYVPQLGDMLSKQEVAPLSGQALTQISPTRLEQLKGYIDWTGMGDTGDWLHQTSLQTPQAPKVKSGWQPAMQR